MLTASRAIICVLAATILVFAIHKLSFTDAVYPRHLYGGPYSPPLSEPKKSIWRDRPEQFPVVEFQSVPKPLLNELPRIQHDFSRSHQSERVKKIQRQRMAQVKNAMKRTWKAYRLKAWMGDEVGTLSGSNKTTFGGWAATLVSTLDTLWIMDLKDEFSEAVDAAVNIDFSASQSKYINVFETTVRFLGGLISAYDLSGDERLLRKTLELADMLYVAFDTPNRLPVLRWNVYAAINHQEQHSRHGQIMAEMGSLSLEFTRLSQITNNPKWYDAVQSIMAIFADQQHNTSLPGLWPQKVNAEDADFFSGSKYSLGATSDSTYEYLPKMYALLGGSQDYADIYRFAMDTALQQIIYRPMIPDNTSILATGLAIVDPNGIAKVPQFEHVSCFAGGMFALGGRLTGNSSHIEVGRKLTDGCVWAYKANTLGIMPELSSLIECDDPNNCPWDEKKWLRFAGPVSRNGTNDDAKIKSKRLPPGFQNMADPHYLLRPEAIESVFVLYRITGDESFREKAWSMFRSIYAATRTTLAHAAVTDVTNGMARKEDSMESFWTAATLKYFYLTFADPDVISLDDYVLNTEAHPFKLGAAFEDKGWLT